MKAKLTISADDGSCYEGEVELARVGTNPRESKKAKKRLKIATPDSKFDFSLPLRAFVTAHGARKLSGPQKFVLLLARLAEGDVDTNIDIKRVEKEWNRMTAPMDGRFNAAYVTRAKDKGWVEPTKQGVYKLRSSWRGAIPF